jgi:hypothetical protein
MAELPTPLKALVGLIAAAVDRLPEPHELPEKALELPVLAVSAALQASLRAQQVYTELTVRGEEVLSQLRGAPAEAPPWASFDETPDDVTTDDFAAGDVTADDGATDNTATGDTATGDNGEEDPGDGSAAVPDMDEGSDEAGLLDGGLLDGGLLDGVPDDSDAELSDEVLLESTAEHLASVEAAAAQDDGADLTDDETQIPVDDRYDTPPITGASSNGSLGDADGRGPSAFDLAKD